MKEHESCLIFCKGKRIYNPIMQERAASGLARSKHKVKMSSTGSGKGDVYGIEGSVTKEIGELRYPSSVQLFNRQRGLHPTQKPVELFEYLIKTYTNEGDLVLDNCAGSGTTAIACENTNRRWVCIEKDETYANKAIERIKAHLAKEQANGT
jgi:site-specific DNA-methyltransferase (adenine-specific)